MWNSFEFFNFFLVFFLEERSSRWFVENLNSLFFCVCHLRFLILEICKICSIRTRLMMSSCYINCDLELIFCKLDLYFLWEDSCICFFDFINYKYLVTYLLALIFPFLVDLLYPSFLHSLIQSYIRNVENKTFKIFKIITSFCAFAIWEREGSYPAIRRPQILFRFPASSSVGGEPSYPLLRLVHFLRRIASVHLPKQKIPLVLKCISFGF